MNKTRETEQMLAKMWMAKAFDFVQGLFGAENVHLGEFRGFPVRKIEHYWTSLEIRWKDKKEPVIFTGF